MIDENCEFGTTTNQPGFESTGFEATPPESHPWPILCNRRILKVSTILTFQILELPNTYHSYHKQKSLNRSCFWSSIPTVYLWGKIHHHHHPHPPSPPFPYPRRPSPAGISFLAATKNDRFIQIPRENQGKTACLFSFFPLIFGVIKIKKKDLLKSNKKKSQDKNLRGFGIFCSVWRVLAFWIRFGKKPKVAQKGALKGASSTCAIAAWFRDFDAALRFRGP